jgi:hypothetical protein
MLVITQRLVPQPDVFLRQMSADMYTDIFDRERYSLTDIKVLAHNPDVLTLLSS